MKRDIVDVYLQVAVGLEQRGFVDSAEYALKRAIKIEQTRAA
jgi:hypothetical protein